MMALNIILLVLDLPLIFVAAALAGRGSRATTLRRVCGGAAMYTAAVLGELAAEWLISFQSSMIEQGAVNAATCLRYVALLPLASIAVSCAAIIIWRRSAFTAYGIALAATLVGSVALAVGFLRMPPFYATFRSWGIAFAVYTAVSAAFWLGCTLFKPDGVAQRRTLTATLIIYAVIVLLAVAYMVSTMIVPVINELGFNLVGTVLVVLGIAVICWPAVIAGGSLLAERLSAVTDKGKHH